MPVVGGNEEIWTTVVVEVAPGYAFDEALQIEVECMAHLRKGAITIVLEQQGRRSVPVAPWRGQGRGLGGC